jgi:threonine dehydrogenase-like Zn-dependent dehydrogenase
MGLQNAQVARFFGAGVVALVDIKLTGQEIARSFGFDVVGGSLDDVRHVAARGFDIVVEARGKTKVAEQGIDTVIRRGTLLQFGACPPGE